MGDGCSAAVWHAPSSPFGTLAHAGPMTRTVDDAALMLDVLSGPDARDWSALPPPTGTFRDHLGNGVAAAGGLQPSPRVRGGRRR